MDVKLNCDVDCKAINNILRKAEKNKLADDDYNKLHDCLTKLFNEVLSKKLEDVEEIICNIFRNIKDKHNELKFVKFLHSQKIKVLPNIAQCSGRKYYIAETGTHSKLEFDYAPNTSKNVDGWFKNPKVCGTPQWIPYDVKKHEISCLGMTFNEMYKYLNLHKDVLIAVYDKNSETKKSEDAPQILLSLKNWENNPIFVGMIEGLGSGAKIETKGIGTIIPTASKYALYKTKTYILGDKGYTCPVFKAHDDGKEILEKKATGLFFQNAINKLFSR